MCVLWLHLDVANLGKSIHFHWNVLRNFAHFCVYMHSEFFSLSATLAVRYLFLTDSA